MKCVFLDIDGVLNSTRTAIALDGYGPGYHRPGSNSYHEDDIYDPKLDPISVAMFKQIVEDSDAKIVISSTWRTWYTPLAFKKMFNEYYQWDAPVIDRTPRLPGCIRGLEIKEWLYTHPGVITYIIIDDDSDMLPEQMQFFVKTSSHNGLSFENFEKARELLGVVDETI